MYDDFSLDSGEFSEDADLGADTTEDVADTEEINDGLYHARTNDEIFTFDDRGDLRSIADMQYMQEYTASEADNEILFANETI